MSVYTLLNPYMSVLRCTFAAHLLVFVFCWVYHLHMASYIKRGKSWQVRVTHKGAQTSKTFQTKGAARAWATNLEHELQTGKPRYDTLNLLGDALDKYLSEIAPKHRGFKREKDFINVMKRLDLTDRPITNVTPADIAKWRDVRLTEVSAGSVLREWNVLSSIFNTAIREWGWIAENPMKNVKKPDAPPPRNRRISDGERDAILAELETGSSYTAGLMWRLALQTMMRQGEICAIRKEHVRGDYIHIPYSKNGHPRDVPLTLEAKEIVTELVTRKPLSPPKVSELFRMAKYRAELPDITFHDSRHEAAVMLADKLSVMELAKMGGWRDVKQLLNTYYQPSPGELVAKLR